MKFTKDKLLQIINEVNLEKVTIPAKTKRFLEKFIEAMKDDKLNRIKRAAILYKVIDGAGMTPETLMKDIQKIKKSLKKEGGPGSGPQSDDDNPFDKEPSDDDLRDIEKQFEGKLTEDFKNNEWEVYVADEKGREKIVKVAKSKRAGVILYNKLINTDKYHEVGMRVIKEGIDEAGAIGGAIDMSSSEDSYIAPKRDTKGKPATFLQKFSSKEAKTIIDGQLKNMVQDIRKVEGRVIKTWMTAAKAGKIDFFDIIRGLKTGDIRRAHTFEMDFFVNLLTRNKIVDRFRSYFNGKKGKKR